MQGRELKTELARKPAKKGSRFSRAFLANMDLTVSTNVPLAIEYRDGRRSNHAAVTPGQVDWDQPTDRVHRAVNVGAARYEEVTIFFLDRPGAVPQPTDD